MYLLDTNILSYWMRGNEALIRRMEEYPPSELSLSAVSLAEILYGIEKSPIKKAERTRKIQQIASQLDIYALDEKAAPHYAVIRASLERKGCAISERDMQIAAIARANGFTLVTHNTREFHRIANLRVEDWVNGSLFSPK